MESQAMATPCVRARPARPVRARRGINYHVSLDETSAALLAYIEEAFRRRGYVFSRSVLLRRAASLLAKRLEPFLDAADGQALADEALRLREVSGYRPCLFRRKLGEALANRDEPLPALADLAGHRVSAPARTAPTERTFA